MPTPIPRTAIRDMVAQWRHAGISEETLRQVGHLLARRFSDGRPSSAWTDGDTLAQFLGWTFVDLWRLGDPQVAQPDFLARTIAEAAANPETEARWWTDVASTAHLLLPKETLTQLIHVLTPRPIHTP